MRSSEAPDSEQSLGKRKEIKDASQPRPNKTARRWYLAQYVDQATQTDIHQLTHADVDAQMGKICPVPDIGRHSALPLPTKSFASTSTTTPNVSEIRVEMHACASDGSNLPVGHGPAVVAQRSPTNSATAQISPAARSDATSAVKSNALNSTSLVHAAAGLTTNRGVASVASVSGPSPQDVSLSLPSSSFPAALSLSRTTLSHTSALSNSAPTAKVLQVGDRIVCVPAKKGVPVAVPLKDDLPMTPRSAAGLLSPSEEEQPNATPMEVDEVLLHTVPTGASTDAEYLGILARARSLATIAADYAATVSPYCSSGTTSQSQPLQPILSPTSKLVQVGDRVVRVPSRAEPLATLLASTALVSTMPAEHTASTASPIPQSVLDLSLPGPDYAVDASEGGTCAAQTQRMPDGAITVKVEPDSDTVLLRPDLPFAGEAELLRRATTYLVQRKENLRTTMRRGKRTTSVEESIASRSCFFPWRSDYDKSPALCEGRPDITAYPLEAVCYGSIIDDQLLSYLRFGDPIGISIWYPGRRTPLLALTRCDISEVQLQLVSGRDAAELEGMIVLLHPDACLPPSLPALPGTTLFLRFLGPDSSEWSHWREKSQPHWTAERWTDLKEFFLKEIAPRIVYVPASKLDAGLNRARATRDALDVECGQYRQALWPFKTSRCAIHEIKPEPDVIVVPKESTGKDPVLGTSDEELWTQDLASNYDKLLASASHYITTFWPWANIDPAGALGMYRALSDHNLFFEDVLEDWLVGVASRPDDSRERGHDLLDRLRVDVDGTLRRKVLKKVRELMRSDAISRDAQEILDILQGGFVHPPPDVVSIGVTRLSSHSVVHSQDPNPGQLSASDRRTIKLMRKKTFHNWPAPSVDLERARRVQNAFAGPEELYQHVLADELCARARMEYDPKLRGKGTLALDLLRRLRGTDKAAFDLRRDAYQMFTDKVKFFLPPSGGEGVVFALRVSSQRLGAHAAARNAYAAYLLAREGAHTVTGEANLSIAGILPAAGTMIEEDEVL